jgi:signal transduction histidine kinase
MTDATMARRGNKLRIAVWGFAAALWLAPLVAMQFSREVNWDVFDFVFFGVMLLVALGAWEVVSRMSPNRSYRAGVGVAVVGGFLLVWANAAVGIIGDGGHVANLGFLAVLLVGMAGALLAWFRPAGMARALYATAAANVGLSVACLVAGLDPRGSVLSLFFVLFWLLSAGLFRKAARES